MHLCFSNRLHISSETRGFVYLSSLCPIYSFDFKYFHYRICTLIFGNRLNSLYWTSNRLLSSLWSYSYSNSYYSIHFYSFYLFNLKFTQELNVLKCFCYHVVGLWRCSDLVFVKYFFVQKLGSFSLYISILIMKFISYSAFDTLILDLPLLLFIFRRQGLVFGHFISNLI